MGGHGITSARAYLLSIKSRDALPDLFLSLCAACGPPDEFLRRRRPTVRVVCARGSYRAGPPRTGAHSVSLSFFPRARTYISAMTFSQATLSTCARILDFSFFILSFPLAAQRRFFCVPNVSRISCARLPAFLSPRLSPAPGPASARGRATPTPAPISYCGRRRVNRDRLYGSMARKREKKRSENSRPHFELAFIFTFFRPTFDIIRLFFFLLLEREKSCTSARKFRVTGEKSGPVPPLQWAGP